MEHKLLSERWLEFLGSGARRNVQFDIPAEGRKGAVPGKWKPLPIGKAVVRRTGDDVTIVSAGLGVHRAMEAAKVMEEEGISAAVLDLRTISPLDKTAIVEMVARTGHLLVVDEDYEGFGLSGELAAVALEEGISFNYARVCTQTTIPYARAREEETLPNVRRIRAAAAKLLGRS
jgi:pyruvate dehydrogenase E1 component beta subunit